MTLKRNLLTYAGTAILAVTGCQTANYNATKINAVPRANIARLEKIAQQSIGNPMTIAPQVIEPTLSYEKSQQIFAVYTHLPAQKISVAYPNSRRPRHTEERTLDTTLLNVGGTDTTLFAIEERFSQVPENACVVSYDLGYTNKDTLSERTPGNQLSRDDGINLIQALSNSKCNNFKIRIKETSYTNIKLRDKDAYTVEIDFSQPEFSAEKKRKDFKFLGEMVLDGTIAASPTGFLTRPWTYLTPGVVILEDAADGLVAYIESKKAPADALLSSNTDYITALPREMSLTSSVLNNSARTQSKEVTLVDLFDECNQPSGQGVVYTTGAYNIHTSPNCATFCLDKDKGSQLIRLIRRLSKVAPVVVETTKTFNSGGGRHGVPTVENLAEEETEVQEKTALGETEELEVNKNETQ